MIDLRKPRVKAKIKCDCGQTVAVGSVYCPHCRAETNRKNAKVMIQEERYCAKSLRTRKGKGK